MAEKRTKLTDEHFAVFRGEAEYWLRYFGLTQWRIRIEWTDETDRLAACESNVTSRAARILLAREWGANDPVTELSLREVAFHEVCELMLSPTTALVVMTFSDAQHQEAAHETIRMLENSVFARDYERRCNGPQTEQTPFGPAIIVPSDKVKMSRGE